MEENPAPQPWRSAAGRGHGGVGLFPEKQGMETPYQVPQVLDPHTRDNPLMPGFGEWKGNCKPAGNRKSAPRRYACGLTQPKNHHESARSNGTWSMSEGNPLTHLEPSPREAGTSRAAPQGLSHRWSRFCRFRLPH